MTDKKKLWEACKLVCLSGTHSTISPILLEPGNKRTRVEQYPIWLSSTFCINFFLMRMTPFFLHKKTISLDLSFYWFNLLTLNFAVIPQDECYVAFLGLMNFCVMRKLWSKKCPFSKSEQAQFSIRIRAKKELDLGVKMSILSQGVVQANYEPTTSFRLGTAACESQEVKRCHLS